MSPQELFDAVRPCLPLPGIIAVDYDPDIKLSFLMETEGDGWQSMPLKPYAINHIIGAIAQACVERGWGIYAVPKIGDYPARVLVLDGKIHSRPDGANGIHAEAKGTDALAWCRAYAQAKESK